MSTAQTYMEKLRAQRDKRVAANKAMANGESFEFLKTDTLPPNVPLWWPKDATEIQIRVLPFIVTEKENSGNNAVGDVVNVRSFKAHYLPNKKAVICPTTYGMSCPLCAKFNSFSKEEKSAKNSPAMKYKAKEFALFNALFRIADGSGKSKLAVRVIKGGYFASWKSLMEEIKNEAGVKENAKFADSIYAFDDPENGYWIDIRCNKASVAGGGASTEFMQFTRTILRWKDPKTAIPEAVYEKIADLDKLIPAAPSADDLRKWMGIDVAVDEQFAHEVDAEEIVDEIPMGNHAAAEEVMIEGEEEVGVDELEAIAEEIVEEKTVEAPKPPKAEKKAVAPPKAAEPVAEKKDDGFDDSDFDNF